MATMMASAFTLSSCDMLLDTMASMYSNPYGMMSYPGNNNYLLDPNYAIWQTQQQMGQMQAVQNQIMDNTIKQTEKEMEELNRINQQLIETSIWQAENGINLGGTSSSVESSSTINNDYVAPVTTNKTHRCGLCGGSGRMVKEDAISFGNTKYCNECGKTVSDSHYHTKCISCDGKGSW